MKRNLATLITMFFVMGYSIAQNETDAYRYSQEEVFGTARYMSLGGSMGAFGADFSALTHSNPAAIGLYKRTEIEITPCLSYTKNTAKYNHTTTRAGKYNFSLSNLSIVTSFELSGKWKSLQFATGYNQTANYHSSIAVKGLNNGLNPGTRTTFIDYLAPQCNGINASTIGGGNTLADKLWYHWLIDTVPGKTNIYKGLMDTIPTMQKQTMATSGFSGEYIFSGGANYDDMLYLGVTIGIPFFEYRYKSLYTEGYVENEYASGYDSLIFEDNFRATSAGINLKLGILYQPVDFLRFGVGFHTPTLYNTVKENYEQYVTILGAEHNDTNSYDWEYAKGNYEWKLTTPYKLTANVAFLISHYGFVNIDYEMKDYSTMNMSAGNRIPSDYDFETENGNIKKYYKPTHTVKFGAEFVINPIALRIGYAYMSNPYRDLDKDGSRHTIACGLGFKGKNFFADFAYQYRITNDNGVFYDTDNINTYSLNKRSQNFVLTLGWKLGKI